MLNIIKFIELWLESLFVLICMLIKSIVLMFMAYVIYLQCTFHNNLWVCNAQNHFHSQVPVLCV